MRSAGPKAAKGLLAGAKNCVNNRLLSLHQHTGSTHPISTSTSASHSTACTQQQQQQQFQDSSFTPLPPVFQERIDADGSLTTGPQRSRLWEQQHASSSHSGTTGLTQTAREAAERAPGAPAAAPAAAPVTQEQLQQLVDLIQSSRNVVALTGAGCSTESNIPDYRGPRGAYTTGFTPMTHQQFMAKPENRRRYWARSFAGWHEFANVQANPAHEGLARLQARGWCDVILTQNVDRLHHKAGSSSVLELHGTTHRVTCMTCGDNSCRHELQRRLSELNPEMAARVETLSSSGISSRGAWERALRAGTAADARKVVAQAREATEQVPLRRPDGDVELVDAGVGFRLAECSQCSSELLKPDVVFFGDSVPKDRVVRAMSAAEGADLMLVVGSSLMVWSAFRLVKAAKEAGARLAIVNVGTTRADSLADLKVEALVGEVMMLLASHPNLLLPRVV